MLLLIPNLSYSYGVQIIKNMKKDCGGPLYVNLCFITHVKFSGSRSSQWSHAVSPVETESKMEPWVIYIPDLPAEATPCYL